jgi:transcriptional regulator with XRE-family HTH domain
MNLAKIRKEKGMTQEALANKVGVLNTSICNYETGIREPGLETLKKLATALEVTVDELLREDDDKGGV